MAANAPAMCASKPTPATLTNSRPSMSPTSMSAIGAVEHPASARDASAGIPSMRARPLPEPAGMIASAAAVPTSAVATSLTVPSPPHATTMRAPRSTAPRASSRHAPRAR